MSDVGCPHPEPDVVFVDTDEALFAWCSILRVVS